MRLSRKEVLSYFRLKHCPYEVLLLRPLCSCDSKSLKTARHNALLKRHPDKNVSASVEDAKLNTELVDFLSDGLVTLHASPSFWKFAFGKNSTRKIQVEKPFDTSEYKATTLVRMAFKAFELGFPFTFGDMDPTVGTIAESQKAKFDKMKDWSKSPFLAYQLKKERTHYCIVKKYIQTKCVHCGSNNSNRQCKNKMCKRCCLEHGTVACRAHKKTIGGNNIDV